MSLILSIKKRINVPRKAHDWNQANPNVDNTEVWWSSKHRFQNSRLITNPWRLPCSLKTICVFIISITTYDAPNGKSDDLCSPTTYDEGSRPSRIRTRVVGSRTPHDGPLHQGPKQACDWPPVFQRNRRNAAPKIATIGNIEPNPGTPRNPSSDSLPSGASCSVNSSPMDPSNR